MRVEALQARLERRRGLGGGDGDGAEDQRSYSAHHESKRKRLTPCYQ